MKRILQILILGTFLGGCIDDDSSELYPENNPNFSHISIKSPTDTLSVDFGENFMLTPDITQTIEGKDLSYRWSANFVNIQGGLGKEFECGTEASINYIFKEKGTYKLKLEVKNEDYSEVKSWTMMVRAYDKGYFVAGNDITTGESTISFARELSPTEKLEGKEMEFSVDLIKKINPTHDIRNVIRIAKSITDYSNRSVVNLHIFTPDKIYVADHETFEIFWVADMTKSFPGEKIVKVGILDTYMTTAYLETDKKRILGYNKNEFGIYELSTGNLSRQYADRIYPDLFSVAGMNMNSVYYWTKNNKIYTNISYFEYGGGTNPANNTMAKIDGKFRDNGRENEYADYDILEIYQMNGDLFEGQNCNSAVVCRHKTDRDHYLVNEFLCDMYGGFTTITSVEFDCPDATYKDGMQLVPNGRFNTVYYADKNKVYAWNPGNVAPYNAFPSKPAIELENGQEISFMRVSYDMRELYVGFYDHNSSEALKGGFYVYDATQIGITQQLKPSRKFEHITTRPTDIIYKTLGWDTYRPS